MSTLTQPKNQKAFLLLEMIQGKEIAEASYNFNRFRGSLSDLRTKENVPIRHADVKFQNSFGRKSTYRKHYLLTIDRQEAAKVYQRINT